LQVQAHNPNPVVADVSGGIYYCRRTGEGKNQKPARFASGEFNSGQTCVKHPQEERRELVDIAAEEKGLRSLQDSKFYNKSPYSGHFRHVF
jgi:hypothetical protein